MVIIYTKNNNMSSIKYWIHTAYLENDKTLKKKKYFISLTQHIKDTLVNEINDVIDANTLVNLTDDQTINGIKTFSDKIIGNSGIEINGFDITKINTDLFTTTPNEIVSSEAVKNYVDSNIFYTNSTPVPEKIGGVEQNTTFNNENVLNILEQLLYPYQYPTFTSFEIQNFQNLRYEVGTEITGEQTFIWSTSNDDNVSIDTISITGQNIPDTLNISNNNSHIINFSNPLTRTSAGTYTWTITGLNTKSEIFTRNKNIRWDFLMYYGSSNESSLNENQIKALQNNNLTASDNGTTGTFSFNAIGYKYFCIADEPSYTKPSNFIDSDTGFAVGMYSGYPNTENGYSYDLVSVTNSKGISKNYRVYRTQNTLVNILNINIL